MVRRRISQRGPAESATGSSADSPLPAGCPRTIRLTGRSTRISPDAPSRLNILLTATAAGRRSPRLAPDAACGSTPPTFSPRLLSPSDGRSTGPDRRKGASPATAGPPSGRGRRWTRAALRYLWADNPRGGHDARPFSSRRSRERRAARSASLGLIAMLVLGAALAGCSGATTDAEGPFCDPNSAGHALADALADALAHDPGHPVADPKPSRPPSRRRPSGRATGATSRSPSCLQGGLAWQSGTGHEPKFLVPLFQLTAIYL